jgi:integrase
MSTRRGHGEGAIYFRESDQRWVTAVDLGYVDGKRKRKVIYGKTRKEVAEKLKVVLRDQQQGLPVATDRQTLGQFLERWLEEKVRTKNRPKTYHTYSQIIRLHVLPTIGRVPLAKLAPQDLDRLFNRKLAEGLSPRTVHHVRAILRTALGQALKWGSVGRNVAVLTEPPQVQPYAATALTPQQAQALLDAAKNHRLESLYHVALWMGLREGEVLGLRWQDIDFEARTLRVAVTVQAIGGKLVIGTPKTVKSNRTLPLPPALIASLRAHHLRQLQERLLGRTSWQDHDLVFPSIKGTPISPRNLVRDFKKLLMRAGLPDIRFHDLRHTSASLLADQGVPVRVAMEILGHSDIRTTQNIYTHVLDDAKREALETMDRLLGAAEKAS